MPTKQSVQLGQVEETLLVPLYARAVETRRKRPILKDAKAVEMVESIDWDFERMGQRWRMMACVMRTAAFDIRVADFLRRHPDGTVVEIGCGLNTRFERLDNGRVHWFDLDLPDSIELRRRFFTDSERRTALAQIARGFPGAQIAFDTGSRRAVERGNRDLAHSGLAARFAWACDDPREIEGWGIGLRLVESRTLLDALESWRSRLGAPMRGLLWMFRPLVAKLAQAYALNLFEVRPDA
jgi:O-methyltransferase involved in polyketide biosynthesis